MCVRRKADGMHITDTTILSELLETLNAANELHQSAHRRPTASQLRRSCERLAVSRDGRCEVYANGYAVYDTGERRCVLRIADCVSYTYYDAFGSRTTLGRGILGELPWPVGLTLHGEDRITRSLACPTYISTQNDGYGAEQNDSRGRCASQWTSSCVHLDGPEEALMKKLAREEALSTMTPQQRRVYILCLEEGYTQAETARQMGITQQSVARHIAAARRKAKAVFSDYAKS